MNEPVFEFGALIRRIFSHWRLHAAATLIAGAMMYGVTFFIPSWYRATTVILPPEETDQLDTGLPVQRFLSRMPSLAGLSNYYTASDIYKAILQSRTVEEAVIQRFNLLTVYRQKSMDRAVRVFRSHIRVALAPDGTIAVSVEDRSRDRAAALTNAMIEELDRFNVERRNFTARRTRQFLQRRVAEIDSLSRLSDAALQAYQEVHHVVTPVSPEQADVRPIGDLIARKMSLEVELSVMRSYLREDNERVLQAKMELERLNAQISGLPRIESESARLARDSRLYQQAYTLLSVQLEDARIREAMDTPTVTLLDPAAPPERRSRPLRTLYALAAMALAGLTSILWSERPHRPDRTGQAGPDAAPGNRTSSA